MQDLVAIRNYLRWQYKYSESQGVKLRLVQANISQADRARPQLWADHIRDYLSLSGDGRPALEDPFVRDQLVRFMIEDQGDKLCTARAAVPALCSERPHAIPLSALAGDNVVTASERLSWYQGPTLIKLLESLSVYEDAHEEAFRFPVQLVARHNGHEANDFRGYMGRIEAGKVARGDKLVVLPSGQSATVKDIQTLDGSLESATAGQSVTILLDEYLDISRGDLLAAAAQPSTILKTVNADVCWLSEEPLDLRRKYWLKHTTKQVAARVAKVDTLLDINTQERRPAETLKLNDIARISFNVQQPIAADAYQDIRATGAFILIDEVSHQTVAAGMIRID
jgi:sulfate adenylyltransferase subunit 1